MFLVAVARPQWDHSRNKNLNGLIGCWPFTYKKAAARSSINRPWGTVVTYAMTSIDQIKHCGMLINKVIPAIRENFPARAKQHPIYIQLDNAGPQHTKKTDTEVTAAGQMCGLNTQLRRQPAQSPDLNCLDLGFFNAICLFKRRSV